MISVHRNALIDPKFLLRQDGRDTLSRLLIVDRLDVVGNGHALVDRSMLRVAVDVAPHESPRAVLPKALAAAIDDRALDQWGAAYVVTDRGRWYQPTYDYKKRRWDASTSGVVLEAREAGGGEPAERPELLIAEHYVHALWPWLQAPDHEFRWDGALEHPAVLCDRSRVGTYLRAADAPKARPCHPIAIVMGMRQ